MAGTIFLDCGGSSPNVATFGNISNYGFPIAVSASYIACGFDNGNIELWNFGGKFVKSLKAHHAQI